MKHKNRILTIAFALFCILVGIFTPIQVSGEVKQITETEDKLEGITEEEKAVLEELFSLSQKIEDLETEKDSINLEITTLQKQIEDLEKQIEEKKKDYDSQLDILEQVLVDYQRGGPATYLEILLKAENLSSFLKSLNVIKDISHNMNELLTTLEEGKKALLIDKASKDAKAEELELKNADLTENLRQNEIVEKEKETYLNSLQEDKAYYEEQLKGLEKMWASCKSLFPKLADEIMNTINEGYFTMEDLNLDIGFINGSGYIKEETFNNLLVENSELFAPEFEFKENQVILTVPKEHLVLTGDFVLQGDNAIQYVVKEGTFYEIPLDQTSIDELFQNGPLQIDFNSMSEGIVSIKFTLNKVESQEGKLAYEIGLIW